MRKRSLAAIAACGAICAVLLQAQTPDLPPGPLQEKARKACLACHDARIIVQQKLDHHAWAKEVDKMTRWGAPVASEDRTAMIDYFAQHFGPPRPETRTEGLAEDPSTGKVRAACLGCHDAGIIAQQQLDRAGWTRTLDKMIRWGAVVRPEDRDGILDYLAKHYPAQTSKSEN